MADIKNYFQEKQKREKRKEKLQSRDAGKREPSSESYKDKIRRHRLSAFYRWAILIITIAVLIILVVVQYRNHIYTSYVTIDSIDRETVSGASDIRLGDTILTYSQDGAHCTDNKGKVLWNQTYEIQDILIDQNQGTAVISSYNGRDVYVANEEKLLGSFTTNLPIRSVAAAVSGRTAVVMADTKAAYINVYTAEGKEEFVGQATMSSSGYPMAVTLSPSGNLMMISYIYLDAGVQKTNIAFYNLGEVGDNVSDHMVSVDICSDVLVPWVRFMREDTAVAVGDNCILFYKGTQKPTAHAKFYYTEEVQSVFYNEDYIGLVFYSDTGNSLYKMNVYSAEGKQVGTYYFNIEYTDLFFDEDTFTVYNDAECMIMKLDQTVKYEGSFQKAVKKMLPLNGAYKYLLVTNDSLDTIQLK